MLGFNWISGSELVCSPGKPAAKPVAAGGTPRPGGELVCGSHDFVNGARGFICLKEYWVRGEKKGGMQSNGFCILS